MNEDRTSAWSVYDVGGIEWMSKYPYTPYISPTPGKIPLIALNPIPYNLENLVRSNPGKYSTDLLRVMKFFKMGSYCRVTVNLRPLRM